MCVMHVGYPKVCYILHYYWSGQASNPLYGLLSRFALVPGLPHKCAALMVVVLLGGARLSEMDLWDHGLPLEEKVRGCDWREVSLRVCNLRADGLDETE